MASAHGSGLALRQYRTAANNLDWIRRGFRDIDRHPPAPTRIACYDLAENVVVDEVNLEDAAMNTVFSIHRG